MHELSWTLDGRMEFLTFEEFFLSVRSGFPRVFDFYRLPLVHIAQLGFTADFSQRLRLLWVTSRGGVDLQCQKKNVITWVCHGNSRLNPHIWWANWSLRLRGGSKTCWQCQFLFLVRSVLFERKNHRLARSLSTLAAQLTTNFCLSIDLSSHSIFPDLFASAWIFLVTFTFPSMLSTQDMAGEAWSRRIIVVNH